MKTILSIIALACASIAAPNMTTLASSQASIEQTKFTTKAPQNEQQTKFGAITKTSKTPKQARVIAQNTTPSKNTAQQQNTTPPFSQQTTAAIQAQNIAKSRATKLLDSIHLVKGEARIIALSPNDSVRTTATHTIYPLDTRALLILPIHYKSTATAINLCINDICKQLKIHDGNYSRTQIKETITVAKSKVSPDKSVQSRIARELASANAAYATITRTSYLRTPLVAPLDSIITSPFGTARMFNGTLKSYHSGTDFRASIGTPIHSANAGLVVISQDRYYAGKSIVIDHGYGVFSQYYHLDELLAQAGEVVGTRALVGKSGATGRVSGPHLHLGIAIKGISVNPLKFINEFNLVAFGKDK